MSRYIVRRLLYLIPLMQVAWSDGGVSKREAELVFEIASLQGIKPGSAAHSRLDALLTQRPADEFFATCLRGIRAMLRGRPDAEADALRRDLEWYCKRVASASGGFMGFGSRISRAEEALLIQLAQELNLRHKGDAEGVATELASGQTD